MESSLSHYNRHGWAVIPNVVSKTRLDAIRRALARSMVSLDTSVGTDKSEGITMMLFQQNDTARVINEIYQHPEVSQILHLHQQKPFVEHSKMLIKAPKGPDTPWHQDAGFWEAFDPEFTMITVWVAVEDVTIDNGCMRILDGTKDSPLFPHEGAHLNMEKIICKPEIDDILARHQIIECPIESGGALIFAAKVVHTAHPNQTDKPRVAFKVTFQDAAKRTKSIKPKLQAVQLDGAKGVLNQIYPCMLPRVKMHLSKIKQNALGR